METFVKLTTAKLAKEKGFNIPTRYCYINNKPHCDEDGFEINWNLEAELENIGDTYSAPTQSYLQFWLREMFNYHIVITPKIRRCDNDLKYFVKVLFVDISNKTIEYINLIYFNSYEDALEFGLQTALFEIKN